VSIGESENSASRHRCSKGNRSEPLPTHGSQPRFVADSQSRPVLHVDKVASVVLALSTIGWIRVDTPCFERIGTSSYGSLSAGSSWPFLLIAIASVQLQGGSLNCGIGAIELIEPLFLTPHVSVKVCADVADGMKG
jgi:hypothetical protein